MNIKEAKQQIKYTVQTYLTQDERGRYRIPLSRQRPIFLMGPPGIGKTAIMEQVAQELGVGMVAYSMTHHTRQSAIGLPFIVERTYGGKTYNVSEYTMSEIIASVYDMMEETGWKEGLLFLDEVNCVSETLAPAMLQFLQYKIFGRHQLPEGWVVVAAGNPPEYNSSAREFDIVTWDRLKRIDVSPEFQVWKEYGYQWGIHPAIMTYLEIRQGDFYQVETTAEGKRFVTARGWADLSDSITLYEYHGLPVDVALTVQYLQDPRIAREFAVYYDLFRKYHADYQVDRILDGEAPEELCQRAAAADFDERLALIGLLLDGLFVKMREQTGKERTRRFLFSELKELRNQLAASGKTPAVLLDELLENRRKQIERGTKASALSREEVDAIKNGITLLEKTYSTVQAGKIQTGTELLKALFTALEDLRQEGQKSAEAVGKCLNNAYAFCKKAFPEGQELLILTTELTVNSDSVQFIGKYGCAAYFQYNKDLLLYERQLELWDRLEDIDLDALDLDTL